MAMMVRVITGDGTETRTVESGASVQVSPAARIQIVVDGVVIDPAVLALQVNPPDLLVTLPDGQTLSLGGFVDLVGRSEVDASAGGLAGPDGSVVIGSTLESLSAPAAGGPPGGADSAGANNLPAFNQALLEALGGAFGASSDFEGLDPVAVLSSLQESSDPNQFLINLLGTQGVVLPEATAPIATFLAPAPTPAAPTPIGAVTPTADATAPEAPSGPPPAILSDLFTPEADTVDLSDITAVLTLVGLDPANPASLAVFLLAVAAGFNISDALAGEDTVELPDTGDVLAGLVPSFEGGLGGDTITGGGLAETIYGGDEVAPPPEDTDPEDSELIPGRHALRCRR